MLLKALERIYKNDYLYKKAGVIVSSFVPEIERIVSLFDEDLQKTLSTHEGNR